MVLHIVLYTVKIDRDTVVPMSANCMLFSDLSEVELMTSPIPYHTQYPFPITLGTFRLVSYIRSSTPLLHPQPHGFADFVCFS